MRCNYYHDLIIMDIEHALSSEDKKTLNTHLETCQSCKDEYANCKSLLSNVRLTEKTDDHIN